MPSVEKVKDPCSKDTFWLLPENHYWNKNNYTEKSKKELDAWVERLRKSRKPKDIHKEIQRKI
jgi:hypothetical protein